MPTFIPKKKDLSKKTTDKILWVLLLALVTLGLLAGCVSDKVLYRGVWTPTIIVPPELEVIVVADTETATHICRDLIPQVVGPNDRVDGCYRKDEGFMGRGWLVIRPIWWQILHEFKHVLGIPETEVEDSLQPWGQR